MKCMILRRLLVWFLWRNAASLTWTTWTTCWTCECSTRHHRRGSGCYYQTAAWVRPSGKAQGKLAASLSAALSPSSWNRGHRLAHPVDHRGCPPVILLAPHPAILPCYSVNSWWTVASHCRGGSPWHTHPGKEKKKKNGADKLWVCVGVYIQKQVSYSELVFCFLLTMNWLNLSKLRHMHVFRGWLVIKHASVLEKLLFHVIKCVSWVCWCKKSPIVWWEGNCEKSWFCWRPGLHRLNGARCSCNERERLVSA